MLSSTGVKQSTSASGSQPSGNTKKDRIQQPPSSTQKNKVEARPRTVKSSLKNKNCVVEPKGPAIVKYSKLNANSKCVKCNGCMLSENHDLCVVNIINDVVQIVLWYLDSGCSKHMTEDRSQLTNFVNKFLGAVKFGNDHVARIIGYGDYQIGNVTISRVTTWKDLDNSMIQILKLLFVNTPASFASKTKSWLWHRRLSHLNFGAINHLARHDLVREENHNLDVAHMNNDPFFGISIPKNVSEASSSSDVIPTVVYTAAPNSEHVNKWTKHHPLDNIIGELERLVSIRLQLYEQALFFYYDAFLSSVEPKPYKDALTRACWIEAMQEKLNEFERLEV
nr:integrase, catalytic region, zinc finger, CCHC-type, peptidase aspartic, catalytic [Tanacetum cinerariifolium]